MWLVFMFIMCLAFKASASQVNGDGNLTADYGGEAHYKCKLDDSKGVVQVTWQRLYEDNSIENLATYSERFGEQVNDPYQGKIVLTEASLRSTSITVRNLTWADESCYVCSFNAYPGGSKWHQTCLKVRGVSQVKTQLFESNDDPEDKNIKVTFTCSATGKPTPKIQWEHRASRAEQSKTSVSINDDQTLTSSRNISLQLSPDWDGHVDCVINPGMSGEKKETITFTKNKGNTEKENGMKEHLIPVVISILVILLIIIGIVLWLKRSSLQMRCNQDAVIL